MKRDDDGYPIAECYRDGVHWVVPVCPLCSRKHLHGYAGGIGGHRVAHCLDVPLGWERGYILSPVAGPSRPKK